MCYYIKLIIKSGEWLRGSDMVLTVWKSGFLDICFSNLDKRGTSCSLCTFGMRVFYWDMFRSFFSRFKEQELDVVRNWDPLFWESKCLDRLYQVNKSLNFSSEKITLKIQCCCCCFLKNVIKIFSSVMTVIYFLA